MTSRQDEEPCKVSIRHCAGLLDPFFCSHLGFAAIFSVILPLSLSRLTLAPLASWGSVLSLYGTCWCRIHR